MHELSVRLAAMSPERRRYTLRDLPTHLAVAGQSERLRDLLTAFAFLEAKVSLFGAQSAIEDYELISSPGLEGGAWGGVNLIKDAIRLAAHVLSMERTELWNQLYGRLMTHEEPEVRTLLARPPGPCWLRPLVPTFTPVGGALRRTFTGHAGEVSAVAVTPDGRSVISGSSDRTIKVWDVQTGREEMTISGHRSGVSAVASTADGHRIVSAAGRMLKVWDRCGRETHSLRGHVREVCGFGVTRDGGTLVSGSHDLTVRVWDLDTGVERQTLRGHDQRITAVAVSPDGTRAVSSARGGTGTTRVWDLVRGAEQHRTEQFGGSPVLLVTPDGDRVISAAGQLEVWDIVTGELCFTFSDDAAPRTFTGGLLGIEAAALSPDGRRLVTGSVNQTLTVWDLEAERFERTLRGHSAKVTAVAVSPDGTWVVSGSADSTLKVWSLGDRPDDASVGGHDDLVQSVVLTPDARFAISAGQDRTLRIWDVDDGHERLCVHGLSDSRNPVAVTPDGRYVLSSPMTANLKQWDVETGEEIREFQGGSYGYPSQILVSPDGRRAITFESGYGAAGDGTLEVWDLQTGGREHDLGTPGSTVNDAVVTRDGLLLIAACEDRAVRAWDLESGEAMAKLDGHPDAVVRVVAPLDGRRVVSVCADGTLTVWDLEGGRKVRRAEADDAGSIWLSTDWRWARSIWLSTDGRCVIRQTKDHRLIVDDPLGNAQPRVVGHPASPLHRLEVAEDTRRLVTLRENTLEVWDLVAGARLAGYRFDSLVTAYAVSSDGATIVAGDTTGRVHFLQLVFES